jgi:hypothetical protein
MYFLRVTDNFRQCIHKSLTNEQMNPMVGEDRSRMSTNTSSGDVVMLIMETKVKRR